MSLECEYPSSSSRLCIHPTTPRVFIVCCPIFTCPLATAAVTQSQIIPMYIEICCIQCSQLAIPKPVLQAILAVQTIKDHLYALHHTKHQKVHDVELIHHSYWFSSGTLLTGGLQRSGYLDRDERIVLNQAGTWKGLLMHFLHFQWIGMKDTYRILSQRLSYIWTSKTTMTKPGQTRSHGLENSQFRGVFTSSIWNQAWQVANFLFSHHKIIIWPYWLWKDPEVSLQHLLAFYMVYRSRQTIMRILWLCCKTRLEMIAQLHSSKPVHTCSSSLTKDQYSSNLL